MFTLAFSKSHDQCALRENLTSG